jgi:hypothetical protein
MTKNLLEFWLGKINYLKNQSNIEGMMIIFNFTNLQLHARSRFLKPILEIQFIAKVK